MEPRRLNWAQEDWDEDGNHVHVFVELRYISPLTMRRAIDKIERIKANLRRAMRNNFKQPILETDPAISHKDTRDD